MRRILSQNSRPAEVVTIAYQLLMIVTVIFYYPAIENNITIILYHLVVISFVLWLPNRPDTKFWIVVKDFYPVVIIPTNFSELHYLVHNVNPIDWDNALIAADRWIFGTDPTVWMERWAHPLVTEYLQVIYTTFYFLPIILGILLLRRNARKEFSFFIFIIVYGFYLSYIGYFLVPAIGPRFTLDHLQSFPVTGLWLTEHIRHTLDTLENIQRDAFPSGHTEMTVLTMFYAWKYHRGYFWVLAVVGTSLVFSTVYLRYHYVVDVLGGVVLALFVVMTGRWLYNEIEQKIIKRETA